MPTDMCRRRNIPVKRLINAVGHDRFPTHSPTYYSDDMICNKKKIIKNILAKKRIFFSLTITRHRIPRLVNERVKRKCCAISIHKSASDSLFHTVFGDNRFRYDEICAVSVEPESDNSLQRTEAPKTQMFQ